MCGRLNVIDSPGVGALCQQLDIALWPSEGMIQRRFVKAADRVSMIRPIQNPRTGQYQLAMNNAIWWLLLDKPQPPSTQFRPSKYTSFNTRYDKLNVPRSAGYQAFRTQRCIIPVTGFGETTKIGSKLHYTDMIAADDKPMALAGLYRQWQTYDSFGQPVVETSCSVVTLGAHPKLAQIHPKSTPLMLSFDDGSLATWLDPSIQTPEPLMPLLTPRLRHSLIATPIDRPSSHQGMGPSVYIQAD
jgi:putative SOS response-associated peptidase YedK